MKVTPKTEAQLIEESLMPDGVYDFEIVSAVDTKSKAGNDVIKIGLNVFDHEGKPRGMNDYIVDSMEFKIRHAADACKILDKYEAGELLGEDFAGKTGKLRIGKQPDSRDGTLRNVVKDYIKRSDAAYGIDAPTGYTKPAKSAPTPAIDDEIPF